MVPTQEALNDRMQMLVEQQKELERRHADLLATTRSNHVRHVREHLEKLANDRNLRLAGTRRRRPNVHPAAPSHFSDEDSDIESHHDVPSMLFKQNRRPASIVTARGKAVERRLIRRSYKRVRTMENAANDPDATDESGDETDVETLIAGKSRHQTVRVDRLFVHPPLELVHTSSFQRALDKARANLPAVPLTTRHSETDRIATESVLQNAAAQYIGARRTAALTHLTESHKVLWRWRWLERQVQLLDEMLVVDRAALAALESNNDVSAVLAAADEAIGAADDQSRDVVQSAMVVENAAAAAVSEATDTDAGAAHAMRTELIANLGGHRSTLVRRHRGMAMLPSGSTPAKQQQQQPAHPASSPLKAGGVNSELCRAPQVMARPFSEKIAQLDQDFHPVLSFSTDMSPEMNFAPFNMAITRAHMQQLYSQQQSQEAIAFSAATRPSALNHAAAAAAFVNSMQGSSSAGPSVPDSQHVVQSLEHQQQELEALQQRLVQATASLASGRSSEFDPAVVAQQLAQYKQSLQQLQFANNGSSSSEHDPMMTEDGGFAAPAALKNQRTTSTSLPGSVSRARTNSFSSTSLPPASYATPPRLGGNSRRPSSSARPSSLASSFPSSPLGAGSAFGSPAPSDPNSPFVAPAAARKRRHMDDWDFDNMIVPQSTARIERIQYKEILTPSWRSDTVVPSKNGASSEVAGNEPVSASETPSDKTPGDAVPSNVAPAAAAASAADEEHEEDLSDEAYARMHQALEIAERRRFLNFVNLRDQTGRPGDAAGSSGTTTTAAAAPRPSGGSMGFAAISLRQVQLQQQTAVSSASESPGDSSSDVPAASPSGSHQLRGVNRKVEAAIELFGNVEALARNYVQHFSAADFQAQSQFEPRSFPMTRAQFEQVLTENNAIESQLMNERLRYEEAYRASPQWSERPHYFYYDHIQTIHGRQQPLPFVAAPGFMAGHVMAGGLSHSNGYAVKTEDNDSDSPDDEDEDDEEEDDEPQRANHADDELEVENANDSHDDQDEDNRDAENDDGDDSDDDEDDEDDEAPSASSNHRHAVGEDSDDDYSVSTPRKRDRRPRPARARASAPPVPATSADVAPPSGPPVKTVLILKLGKSVIRKDLSDTPASAASDALPMTE
ncbi:hypothetical protein CAOG_03216 [Capsaspora owczarzaki ATCC 30864]|uniref:PEHE domain-containing protein n=1 Tax=Capsaspora owczarzaki (strain ATCC 30864) TaxID=595528 RepID=A0A0D2WNX4_CAPO3|nr:hypothetical protein CAOG_03216 [Capsaspora owczarzaki ATCC 30864]KJE92203.1 hypothetical protein CAOG_003216 [Capsaspora owczarzaki ATCC 30864]|eukprot:XP_004364055.1 hypothetical protein CAOG_03216 [Capsaspora owczarzaki ATCC 30864]